MPLVRYEIRNEYSLANSELYRSAGKDDPAALLEGVAMAGLVGIVRQLGDLAEFAAEIFHDLHEEVMATAARGHGLMIRVQQLEAEFPSVEKALMSEKNQLRFAYAIGADWHASIRYDQNHLTQGDLPRFILNSYEECRGPPRLFLLDKFDGAGAGACLKRYTDPSFFKIKWAGTELMKAEEARRQKKARRVKKKGQRQRNGETTDFTPVHGRVRYSSLNLERPKHFRGNLVNTSKQKLKSKEVYETPLPDQRIEREHLKGPLNISSPMEEHVPGFSCMFDNNLNSKHFNSSSVQDQVINRHYAEGPNEKFIFGEDASESFSHESEEKPAVKIVQRVKLNDNITTISSSETQSSRIIAEVDADRIYQNFIHAEQNDVLVNSEIKQEANVNEDENDDVASETDNYVDALATMELEIETDSESKTKHEVDPDFNSKHKETGRELLERHAYCLEFSDAEATAFYNCDSSDESSKIETSSGFLNNNPAYVSSNLESTSCTVTSTSECDSANVDLKNNLDSASLSLGISKDLFFASNDGSLMSSEVLKNVHLSLDEKMQNDTDVSVKEEKLNGIDMPTPVADAISHAVTANVEMNNFVNKEFSSAFQNNDSRDAFANASCLDGVDYGEESFRFSTSGSSLLLGTGEPQTSPYKEPVAVSESFEGIMEDDYLQISSLNVHEGEDLGYPAISNNYIDESAATSELAAGKENSVMHASHEFIGSQTDDAENELPEPREYEAYDSHLVQLLRGSGCSSPVSPGQIFIESDINIKHSGPAAESMPQHSIYAEFIGPGIDSEVRDDQSCTDRCLGHVPTLKSIAGSQEIDLEVSECTESTLKSIAGSQEIDLEVSKCTESILDPRTIDLPPQLNAREGIQDSHFNSSKTSPTEDSECSSPVSVGQPSVESDVDIEHSESAAESMPQDSVHAESIVTGMDSEVRDDQSCAGRYVGHVPALKSKMDGGENGESPENTYATEAMKSKMGLQEDDQEVPECAESVLDVRPIDLPPQLNLPEGFQNDHVNSSKASPTEALNACSGDNFTSISDGSNFIEKNISNDIPTKEVKIYSEEAMDIDAAAVKIPINSSILDNTCRKELSTEFASAETSINDRVLPDVSSHSKSTETWNDGGSFEKNVDIESHSDSHFEPPTELFNSWTSANSFSENVYMDSLHAEQNMQILHVIPPVKPNASPHSGSVEPCSDGGLFENNVKSESHANVHLGAPPEVFSSSPSANLFSKTVEADSPSAKSDMLLLHVIPPVKPVGAEPVLHVIPAVKPVGAEPVLHVIPPVKPVGAEPVLHVIPPVKPGGAEEQARSPSNFNNKEDLEDEPPSPPLEHIKISFPPPDSPLSMYSTSSDHVSESPSPGKHKHSQSKADELSSSFHLLPEPAIPLQQADENPNMRIMGSLSLHRQRKSSETFSDKLHISQIKDTDDDSEDEGLKEFGKSSPEISPAFYNQSLGPTEGLAVFSGRNAVSDADTGSPGVLSTTSMTISSSPDTARNSLLNFKCSSADAASSSSHSRNISLGSSPRSTMFSAPHSPISFEETCHEIQDLSMSDSPALESGALVLSSSTLEDNIECNWHEMPPSPQETCERNQELFRSKSPVLESGALVPSSSTLQSNSESTFNEMPPPPPLPPLEWRMMKPQKISSLPLLEGVKPPTPPAFPPPIMTNSLMQDPSSSSVPAIQKMPVDRRDSLIEEIASHDKTTLKKVPKQVAPISAKPVDEREVLLKQIRTKSFNLRPTSVVKHNIPRPTTNINVAAILEKANAIRQAFAGSDEDDDEGGVWSDA